jgi:hypothetical protein
LAGLRSSSFWIRSCSSASGAAARKTPACTDEASLILSGLHYRQLLSQGHPSARLATSSAVRTLATHAAAPKSHSCTQAARKLHRACPEIQMHRPHLGCWRQEWRVLDDVVLIHDAPHDHHGVICLGAAEGLPASQQHVHQHAQAPPVDAVVVAMCKHCRTNRVVAVYHDDVSVCMCAPFVYCKGSA